MKQKEESVRNGKLKAVYISCQNLESMMDIH